MPAPSTHRTPPRWHSGHTCADRTACTVESVCPLPGAGTGSLISSDDAICNTSASATISARLSSATSPRSICDRRDLLIPASPATTRYDLSRALRIWRSRARRSWNPRSSYKPSTASVRTRPPGRSDASARRALRSIASYGRGMGITYTDVIDAPLDDVFAWHERRGALARLAPPWQPMRVVAEAESLRDGRAVLKFPGGLTWVAQHSGYDPPHRFVDELTSLPLHWRHTHEFAAETDRTTRVTDHVDTQIPGHFLRSTFVYRHRQLAADLAAHRDAARTRPEPLTVAITGASGLIGSALAALLTTGGHRVIRLVRHAPDAADERRWRPDDPLPGLLEGVDAVVHLAGAPIGGRFTDQHKRGVRDSRIGPTRALAELIARVPERVGVFVSASAIGYYGPERADEPLTESSSRGTGFLADVVTDWEAATQPARDAGVRTVNVRTGIVQSPRGGTLQIMRPLFTAGLGGRLGSGEQWTSWIDLDDLTDIYYRALVDTDMDGPVNAVAPEPVRNHEYTATLARVLRRPAVLPVPALGPRLLLGAEGATELANASQRVQPERLTRLNHRFRQPTLEACLRHQLGREQT